MSVCLFCSCTWINLEFFSAVFELHPGRGCNKSTWAPPWNEQQKHLKIGHPKSKLIFQPSIFRGSVSFREGNFDGILMLKTQERWGFFPAGDLFVDRSVASGRGTATNLVDFFNMFLLFMELQIWGKKTYLAFRMFCFRGSPYLRHVPHQPSPPNFVPKKPRLVLFPNKNTSINWSCYCIPLVWPPPCNSDHQDYETSLGSGIPGRLHFPLLQGGGHTWRIIPLSK